MALNKTIPNALYSVSLGPRVGTNSSNSYMILGDIDKSHYVGELIELPVVPNYNNWWTVSFKQMTYGGIILTTFIESDNAIAVLDTGTSMLSVPTPIYKNLVQQWFD